MEFVENVSPCCRPTKRSLQLRGDFHVTEVTDVTELGTSPTRARAYNLQRAKQVEISLHEGSSHKKLEMRFLCLTELVCSPGEIGTTKWVPSNNHWTCYMFQWGGIISYILR